MAFNSLIFFIFIAFFFLGWAFVKKHTFLRLCHILLFSSIFYGWWDWRFLFLIYFTGGIDFLVSLGLHKANALKTDRQRTVWRRLLLCLSLMSGLGVLSIFKYSQFFANGISQLLACLGLEVNLAAHIPPFCLILPVGISFYTFQSLSYTIDVYRGNLKPTRSFIHYMAYLMFFPQLVAGPIVRAVDLLPRLLEIPHTTASTRYGALKLIVLGFFKKCLLADNAAILVDQAFNQMTEYTGCFTWCLVILLFAIQIYCDFSGYSDIARGLAKMMGYRFNLNFNHPYRADSIRDFWRRWHISLSSWFKIYVYIPLGGSRKGKWRTCLNIIITFTLSGLWHGAAMNFVLWGFYHAMLLVWEQLVHILPKTGTWKLQLLKVASTQIKVLIGWFLFRIANLEQGQYILSNLLDVSRPHKDLCKSTTWITLVAFILMELYTAGNGDYRLWHRHPKLKAYLEPALLAVIAIVCILYRGESNGFIYFQF